ncbi:MAG TPA: hypothetical protein VK436_05950 [Methanocella sp.]|nr:hypothetical protein [Methanocella sp.]
MGVERGARKPRSFRRGGAVSSNTWTTRRKEPVDSCSGYHQEARRRTVRCAGEVVPKTLKDRTRECPYCRYAVNRDFSAARNILMAGVTHAEEPVGSKPPLHISVEQALIIKQEVTTL